MQDKSMNAYALGTSAMVFYIRAERNDNIFSPQFWSLNNNLHDVA